MILPSGSVLGEYDVVSALGQGGFGVVYKGRHRDLGIEVAIKEYFPEAISARDEGKIRPKTQEFVSAFGDGMERFLQEAKQLVRFVEQPNIVTCRGFFRANGTAYTVMDYVSGLPLSGLLAKREAKGEPLSEEEMLAIMIPLLEGLQKVHEADVCHRDIKPSNILIRHPDGVPVLIDFGAAKYEMSERTKSVAPFTDGYAAWEQVGEGEIGPWTDIYGVGAVMWRIVAGGNPPYLPPNPPSTQKRVFEAMKGRPDPLPSARKIGQGRFSENMLSAIDACLVIEVEKRVQDCGKLLGSIQDTGTQGKKVTYVADGKVAIEDRLVQQNWHPKLEVIARCMMSSSCFRIERLSWDIWNRIGKDLSPDSENEKTLILEQLKKTGILYENPQYGSYGLGFINIEEFDRMVALGWPDETWWQKLLEEESATLYIQNSLKSTPDEYFRFCHIYQTNKDLVQKAENGDAEAQLELGMRLSHGEEYSLNNIHSFDWTYKSAINGNPEAQYRLAGLYEQGEGVFQDLGKAIKWSKKASKQGYVKADRQLKNLHRKKRWGHFWFAVSLLVVFLTARLISFLAN